MARDDMINEYFEWMYGLVCDKAHSKRNSYRKLLMCLHNTEFRYTISNDRNRAEDGLDLRSRFAAERGYNIMSKCWEGPCSVLEMLIALALRCETHIMDDPDIGDRTGQWFWIMIGNLNLKPMTDENFDKSFVNKKVSIFLDRQYRSDGKGGLFVIDQCKYDLRTVEIWYQMCWYLDIYEK